MDYFSVELINAGGSMSLIRMYFFGTPRIERDGSSIPFQRRRTLALLAYLVVTGRPQSRDGLAALLWPEEDPAAARASLRRELSRLKEILGNDALDADRASVGLCRDFDFWLDIDVFRTRVERVREHSHVFLVETPARPCPVCLPLLAEAVEICTGDFLEGFSLPGCRAFEEWQFFETEGLRQALAESLQLLANWYAGQGDYRRSVETARRWLALDDLHEPAHRLLMRLYAWNGQQSAALRQYQECARRLKEELGVQPAVETRQLFQDIQDRRLAPPGQAVASAPALLEPAARFEQAELWMTGGFGEIYRGYDHLTGQPVIIKRLRTELVTNNPQLVARFVREGEALRRLNHPNIVALLATFEQDGQHRIVMEYVPGGSLRSLLEKQPQLSLEQALQISLELADALSRAHHLDILHRDIKPDNVLLASDGAPRLTDFGLARLGRLDIRLTLGGTIMGSPGYMSPEALRGDTLDARSDIWSFGVMLYEMLAGRLPFPAEELTALILAILNEPAPEILQFRSDLPGALVVLLRQMLEKERDRRPASMRQVAAGLEEIRAGLLEPDGHPDGSRPAARAAESTPGGRKPLVQEIRFCTSGDGVRVAYAISGEGPPLVKAANWLSHLEFDWTSPFWRHWLAAFSSRYTLVRYDERGCGLSDWEATDLSFDAWVSDLEAVVEAARLEHFALLGISQGGPIAIAYAVRHPEKVSHLILYGSYARGRVHRSLTERQKEERQLMLDMVRIGWGQEHPAFRQVFTTMFLPEGTPEQIHAFNELQRITSSPEIAARILMGFDQIDVRSQASLIHIPALVLHAKGDLRVPFGEGRLLASLIPGARFVPLDSRNHILLETEPAWRRFLLEVDAFMQNEDSEMTTLR
jgi:DNA-binding SARP family transcriptional activator/pimeloyl-ACP methyl ester carboxylesterase